MTADSSHVTWLDQQQQRSWRAFLVGTTLLMDRLDRDLREQHRLSLPEYEILVRLSEAEGNRWNGKNPCLRSCYWSDSWRPGSC